jgi:O-antigen/teichoic acid export membrane protein
MSLGGASLLINFAGFILLKTDPLIVRTFLPFAQVAMYAVALRIAENVFLLCKQLVNALTPHAIRAGLRGNIDHAARIFVRATRYVMAVGAPIYVCALVLGRQGIRLWLSPAYESSAVILGILLLAMILSIPQLVGSNLLTFSGHHKKTALFISVGAIINVLASITFVKWTGVTGVAYGTLFTTLVIDVLIVVPFTCRVFNVNLLTFTFGIVRSVLVPAVMQWMTLRVLQLHFHTGTLFMVLLEGAASCAVFLFAFVLFGTIREERSAILQALIPVVGPLRRPLEAR